jgi:glycerol-3-phosphate cytidylyltransferase-like family protein
MKTENLNQRMPIMTDENREVVIDAMNKWCDKPTFGGCVTINGSFDPNSMPQHKPSIRIHGVLDLSQDDDFLKGVMVNGYFDPDDAYRLGFKE